MTLEPLSITLHVLPVDISKAIAAWEADPLVSSDGTKFGTVKVVTRYCPIFQALEREGYKPKVVATHTARLESGTWYLDEAGRKVTPKLAETWKDLSPFTVVLTPAVPS